ncbi:MAG: DUF2029 domain-containing protein, partial [Anaerolineales bacterium]
APNLFIHTPHEALPYTASVLAVHLIRLLSVLCGAGTVAGVFLVAGEILPTRPGVALASAAVAAFNPLFIFISSVVNNDATAACLCTLALWLAIRSARLGFTRKRLIGLGVVVGLALLSKVSALALLILAALALLLTWLRERDRRALLTGGLTVVGLATLVAAWWYIRNWALYGDPLGWQIWLMDIKEHQIGLAELLAQFRHLGTSFYSPYDGLFPPAVLAVLGALAVAAAAGWIRMIFRRSQRADADAEGLLLAGAWFVILFASVVYYMVTTPADEGRLLYPGIAASSLLLVLGWRAVLPPTWRTVGMAAIIAALLVLCIATPFCAIEPRFALPLVSSADDLPATVSFAEDPLIANIRLLGVELDTYDAAPGDTVRVSVYWEVLEPSPPGHMRFVVQLWTESGRLVDQRDTIPAGEAYPPDLWNAGDIVWHEFPLDLWGDDGPIPCRVNAAVIIDDEVIGESSSPFLMTLGPEPVPAGATE